MLHMDYYEVLVRLQVHRDHVADRPGHDRVGLVDADSDFPYNNNCSRLLDAILEGLPSTLSPLDDYPVHQIPEAMRHVGTTDRNFYDRYYFNCHPLLGRRAVPDHGPGPVPEPRRAGRVRAGAPRIDEHRVVRASRELGLDRLDTSVGPFGVEVIEGLKTLRVDARARTSTGCRTTSPGRATIPPFQEPPHVIRTPGAGRLRLQAAWRRPGRGPGRSRSTARRSR